MNKETRFIFDKAKDDSDFHRGLINYGESKVIPKWHWDTLDKIVYAAIYIGWLSAKGVTLRKLKEEAGFI